MNMNSVEGCKERPKTYRRVEDHRVLGGSVGEALGFESTNQTNEYIPIEK